MAHLISHPLPLTVNVPLHHHHSSCSIHNFISVSSPITHTSINSPPTRSLISTHKPSSYGTDNKTRLWRSSEASLFEFFTTKSEECESLKQELLEIIAPLDRGADATSEQQERVDQIARKLEAVNKVKEPLKSDLLNGKWELLYTTSQSILQTKRPKILRANGKIYQAINVDTLRAQNMETWPFFNQLAMEKNSLDGMDGGILTIRNLCSPQRSRSRLWLTLLHDVNATANLVPLNTKRVAVKFDAFKVFGLINETLLLL